MADIGILGGTFDPIHSGHLMLAQQACSEYGLDEIWFMPSHIPPHKAGRTVTDAGLRCEMVRLAIEGHPRFFFSDFEVRRPGSTYTAQTLALLHETWPGHRFFFIIGADSLYELESWYHPEAVMSGSILLVAGRAYSHPHKSVEGQIRYLCLKYGADIRRLHCGRLDISSGELRARLRRGESTGDFLPAGVEAYIRAHRLYQDAGAGVTEGAGAI